MTPIPLPERPDALKRAVFNLVLRGGVDAISQEAVAREVGTSLSSIRRWMPVDQLPSCGLDWIIRRRIQRRFEPIPGEVEVTSRTEHAWNVLLRELPYDKERRDEEIVWLTLATRFAGQRWVDDERAERRDHVQRVIGWIVEGAPQHHADHERLHLTALVHGTTAAIRDGLMAPAVGVALVHRYVIGTADQDAGLRKTS